MIQYLTFREKLETALAWIREYGVNGVSPKILLRLASKMIQNLNQIKEETVLSMCFYAFQRGKADIVTLQYLMDYYEGSTKILRDIWKRAEEKGMDVHAFSERILVQMLYSGCYVGEAAAIFGRTVEKETDISLEKAFLARYSYDYFVKDKIAEAPVFEELGRLIRMGEQVQKVCALAYTRYYAENRHKMRKETKKVLEECLAGLAEEGAILPWFLEYADICPAVRRFSDKTILEHRTRPGSRVFLYYMLELEEEDYRKTEMKEIYEGVFSSMFVLFFGEKLLYYIAEEYEDENGRREEITGSGSIARSDQEIDVPGSRFQLLNDIAIAEALQDYDTLDHMLAEYEKTDIMQKELFGLCK